ncbi:hypothetical protein HDU79_003352 [Rhizoclosmatium sp. JEL0117]|nr:hypothetical protein HDU79_003352 [Rhizoclosmatium sp. JEL0117]
MRISSSFTAAAVLVALATFANAQQTSAVAATAATSAAASATTAKASATAAAQPTNTDPNAIFVPKDQKVIDDLMASGKTLWALAPISIVGTIASLIPFFRNFDRGVQHDVQY